MNKEQTTQFKELCTEFIKFLDQYLPEDEVNGKCEVKDGIITIIDDCRPTSELIAECKKLFPVYFYNENKADKEFPAPQNPTARKFPYTQEPDEKYKNMSANDLKDLPFITLRERLIFELEYFKREGKHLDIDNVTLCSGSRYSDGHVPHVRWNSDDGELFVYDYYPYHSHVLLRARVAV